MPTIQELKLVGPRVYGAYIVNEKQEPVSTLRRSQDLAAVQKAVQFAKGLWILTTVEG